MKKCAVGELSEYTYDLMKMQLYIGRFQAFFCYHGEFYVFWEKRNKRKCKLSCFTKYGLLEILFGCLIFNESVKHFSYDTEKSNQHA